MFSEATYPHSEQTVSPLMSSESQEVLPQTSHEPSTASTLLALDGLGPAANVPFRPLFWSLFETSDFPDALLSIISTSSCIVGIDIFKLW